MFPDGRLQEAGSIIWSDGSSDAYGRNDSPEDYEFNFQRDVDYCSGALLLTRRELFNRLGGFDERYRPAYYEDVDYCVTLWESGYRVVYQPSAVAIHFEFASSTAATDAIGLQQEHRPLFVSRHRRWLASQFSRADGMLAARTRRRGRPSVLVIDDAWPDPRLGSGFPRAAALLRALVDLDCLVSFYPTGGGPGQLELNDSLATIAIIRESGLEHQRSFLTSRHTFDVVIVSRPHNLRYVKAAVGSDLSALNAPVIYDAEAVYATRDIHRSRIGGTPSSPAEEQSMIEREIQLSRGCAAVLTVNRIEQQRFVEAGIHNVVILGHAVRPAPTTADFDSRRDMLFVGAFGAESPNEDAAVILVRDVLPALTLKAPRGLRLTIAGANVSDKVRALEGVNVTVLSDVPDLTALYNSARIFVAPTRYSAGIPLKLLEAAARGVPIVCTPHLARQLDWEPGRDLLTGEGPGELSLAIEALDRNPELWSQLRDSALARVASDCAPETFQARLADALRPYVVRNRRVDPGVGT